VDIKNFLSELFSKKHFFSFSEILAMNQKEQLHTIQQFSAKLNNIQRIWVEWEA